MRKFFISLVFMVVFGLSGLFIVRFLFGGNEDTWICQNGSWVKHGNPSQPMPEIGCGDQGKSVNTGKEKYEIYQVDDFEVKYPYWQNVDKKNLLEPEKTKLAVTDGRCNFAITAISVPANTNFKDYTTQLIQAQLAKTKSKIISQEIQDKTAHFEGEITMGNSTLRSVSYGYMTSKRRSYGVAFIAEKSLFDNACRPIINEVITSVKVR